MANSPRHVISRLFHNGDYFETLSNYQLKQFIPILQAHIEKCEHPKCVGYRNAEKDLNTNISKSM